MQLRPGEITTTHVGMRQPSSHHEKAVPHYQHHVWGRERGGRYQRDAYLVDPVRQARYAATPGERSHVSISGGVQHTLYSYMALPAVVLGGLTWLVKRNTDDEGDDV